MTPPDAKRLLSVAHVVATTGRGLRAGLGRYAPRPAPLLLGSAGYGRLGFLVD